MPILSEYRDGIIYPPSHLEVIVCDHCNIRCSQCNHAAPAVKRWFADPAAVYRELGLLATFYRPPRLKLIGGEPLLHKNLPGILRACRDSGIAPQMLLVTNGLLLDRMPAEAWPLIDVLEVSIYPGQAIPARGLQEAHQRVAQVTEVRHDQFRTTFAGLGTADDHLVGRVYGACKLANLWGCHSLRQGYFYKCPQSIYIHDLYTGDADSDRVELHQGSELAGQILGLINSPQPLRSCRFCAGTSGKNFEHHQSSREEWASETEKRLEEIVDYAVLDSF